MKNIALLTSLITLGSLPVFAGTSTTFGPLPAATFDGTGNPNNPVEVTTITGLPGGNTITLGLAAQQRYENPALAANNGTYFAGTGENYGNPANPTSTAGVSTELGSTWDVDFYASISGGANLSQYSFVLEYALTPGTPVANLGSVNLNNAAIAVLVGEGLGVGTASADVGALTTIQDSENLDFPSFATPLAGVVAPPAGTFNPNATGDYDFVLEAFDHSGNLVGSSAITVDVVPDAASTMSLLGVGCVALAGLRRRFNRA